MKKNILGITVSVMAVFAFIALSPQASCADNNESVILTSESAAAIEINLPQAYGEKVSSLQLSLEVTNQDGSRADADILENIEKLSFSPDEAVSSKAKICEGRYHKDTGILNIYIAGTEPLFSENAPLAVGEVKAVLNDGNTDVYVKLTEDSFKVVKGLAVKTIMEERDAVRLYLSGASTQPEESEKPSPTDGPEPSQNPENTRTPQNPEKTQRPQNPEESQNPQNPLPPEGSGTTEGTSDSTAPQDPFGPTLDVSGLNNALEVAKTLQESDYTADSFAVLKKAIADGTAVLNNPNASQEEIEQAADAIYNAIGTLVPVSTTSSDKIQTASPSSKESKASLTGDFTPVHTFLVILVVSIGVVAVVIVGKKRRNLTDN